MIFSFVRWNFIIIINHIEQILCKTSKHKNKSRKKGNSFENNQLSIQWKIAKSPSHINGRPNHFTNSTLNNKNNERTQNPRVIEPPDEWRRNPNSARWWTTCARVGRAGGSETKSSGVGELVYGSAAKRGARAHSKWIDQYLAGFWQAIKQTGNSAALGQRVATTATLRSWSAYTSSARTQQLRCVSFPLGVARWLSWRDCFSPAPSRLYTPASLALPDDPSQCAVLRVCGMGMLSLHHSEEVRR